MRAVLPTGGESLRGDAMRAIGRATRADVVLSCAVVRASPDAHRLVDMMCVGSDADADVAHRLDGALALRGSIAHRGGGRSQGAPIEAPARSWVNRFIPLDQSSDRAVLERQEVWERLYGPLDTVDQTRLLVYSQGRFVRWVSCLRTSGGGFGRRASAAARAATASTVSAFVEAEALDRAALPDGGRHALVFDSEARLILRSEDLSDWLRADGREAAVAAIVRAHRRERRAVAFLHGFELELVRLVESTHHGWLVTVQYPARVPLSPLACLTERQREIASLLACGATLSEIAAHLDLSINTVKYHAKLIHQRLGVASRAELVRVIDAR